MRAPWHRVWTGWRSPRCVERSPRQVERPPSGGFFCLRAHVDVRAVVTAKNRISVGAHHTPDRRPRADQGAQSWVATWKASASVGAAALRVSRSPLGRTSMCALAAAAHPCAACPGDPEYGVLRERWGPGFYRRGRWRTRWIGLHAFHPWARGCRSTACWRPGDPTVPGSRASPAPTVAPTRRDARPKRSHDPNAPEDAMQRVCPGSGTWMCRDSEVRTGMCARAARTHPLHRGSRRGRPAQRMAVDFTRAARTHPPHRGSHPTRPPPSTYRPQSAAPPSAPGLPVGPAYVSDATSRAAGV